MFDYSSDEKFDIRSDEYKNYLIARDYNIFLVEKQYHSVRSVNRGEKGVFLSLEPWNNGAYLDLPWSYLNKLIIWYSLTGMIDISEQGKGFFWHTI